MDTVLVVGDGEGGFYVIPQSTLEACRADRTAVGALLAAEDGDDVAGFGFEKRSSVSDSHDRYASMAAVGSADILDGPFAFRAPAFKWSRENGSIIS